MKGLQAIKVQCHKRSDPDGTVAVVITVAGLNDAQASRVSEALHDPVRRIVPATLGSVLEIREH